MKKVEEIRRPTRPSRKEPPSPPPHPEPEQECQAENELPCFPISPPPMPWPRVFPDL
jgi:hypothetical protein